MWCPIPAAAALDIKVDLDMFKVDQVGTFDYAPFISQTLEVAVIACLGS